MLSLIFARLNFRDKVPRKKGPAKLKTRNLETYIKAFIASSTKLKLWAPKHYKCVCRDLQNISPLVSQTYNHEVCSFYTRIRGCFEFN